VLTASSNSGAGDGNRTRGLHFKGSASLRPHAPLAHSGARFAFHPCPTHGIIAALQTLERETGIEPATNSLEGCDSTTELLPRRPFKGFATLRCFALMLRSRYSGARFAFHPPFNLSRSLRVPRNYSPRSALILSARQCSAVRAAKNPSRIQTRPRMLIPFPATRIPAFVIVIQARAARTA
jgi:hypothetical protein